MDVQKFLSSFTGQGVDAQLSIIDNKLDAPRFEGEKGQAITLNSIGMPQWSTLNTQYLFVKYSQHYPTQDADISDEPGPFVGIRYSVSPAESTIFTMYRWYKLPGATGDVGPKGNIGNKGLTGDEGPRGVTGKPLKILGYFDTAAELGIEVTNPNDGDAYIVGNDIDIYDAEYLQWRNYGPIEGPEGLQGVKGDTGDQGPQGDQGVQGNPVSVAVSELTNGVHISSGGIDTDIFNGLSSAVSGTKLIWIGSGTEWVPPPDPLIIPEDEDGWAGTLGLTEGNGLQYGTWPFSGTFGVYVVGSDKDGQGCRAVYSGPDTDSPHRVVQGETYAYYLGSDANEDTYFRYYDDRTYPPVIQIRESSNGSLVPGGFYDKTTGILYSGHSQKGYVIIAYDTEEYPIPGDKWEHTLVLSGEEGSYTSTWPFSGTFGIYIISADHDGSGSRLWYHDMTSATLTDYYAFKWHRIEYDLGTSGILTKFYFENKYSTNEQYVISEPAKGSDEFADGAIVSQGVLDETTGIRYSGHSDTGYIIICYNESPLKIPEDSYYNQTLVLSSSGSGTMDFPFTGDYIVYLLEADKDGLGSQFYRYHDSSMFALAGDHFTYSLGNTSSKSTTFGWYDSIGSLKSISVYTGQSTYYPQVPGGLYDRTTGLTYSGHRSTGCIIIGCHTDAVFDTVPLSEQQPKYGLYDTSYNGQSVTGAEWLDRSMCTYRDDSFAGFDDCTIYFVGADKVKAWSHVVTTVNSSHLLTISNSTNPETRWEHSNTNYTSANGNSSENGVRLPYGDQIYGGPLHDGCMLILPDYSLSKVIVGPTDEEEHEYWISTAYNRWIRFILVGASSNGRPCHAYTKKVYTDCMKFTYKLGIINDPVTTLEYDGVVYSSDTIDDQQYEGWDASDGVTDVITGKTYSGYSQTGYIIIYYGGDPKLTHL